MVSGRTGAMPSLAPQFANSRYSRDIHEIQVCSLTTADTNWPDAGQKYLNFDIIAYWQISRKTLDVWHFPWLQAPWTEGQLPIQLSFFPSSFPTVVFLSFVLPVCPVWTEIPFLYLLPRWSGPHASMNRCGTVLLVDAVQNQRHVCLDRPSIGQLVINWFAVLNDLI